MAVSLDDQLPATILDIEALKDALGEDYAALALGFHYWASAHAFNTFADADRAAAYLKARVVERAPIFGKLNPKTAAKAMVDAGLWERDGDYYIIPDYLDYNPPTERREKDRRGATLRKRRERLRKRASTGARGAAVMSHLLSRRDNERDVARDTDRDDGRDVPRDEGRDAERDSARARMPLTLNPLTQDHRASRGTHAMEAVENGSNVVARLQLASAVNGPIRDFRELKRHPLKWKGDNPRVLKRLAWTVVEQHYGEDASSLYERVKCEAAAQGLEYGKYWLNQQLPVWIDHARVRCHIRELVQAGLRGFMLAHAVEERLRSVHLSTVLDADSLTRAIESELKRLKQRRRHA